MKSSKLLLSLAAAAAYCSAASMLSAFTITTSQVVASTYEGIGTGNVVSVVGISPGVKTVTASGGNNSATASAELQGSGDNVTLSLLFDQNRVGAMHSYANLNGFIQFSVSASTTYEVSGNYAVTDASGAGTVYLASYMTDVSLGGAYLYNSAQQSNFIENESFTLGGAGGDTQNQMTGFLTGSLVAGHTYRMEFFLISQAIPDADGGTVGSGALTFKIGNGAPAASVPDAGSSLGLLGLALAAVAAARRRAGSPVQCPAIG